MTLKINGSTDGSVSIDAPADTSPTGSDITLTLPTTVGSANQFVKNGGTAGELEYSSMVETSTGVGIGTTSPTTELHVGGSGQQDILIGSTNAGGARLVLDGDSNGDASGGDFAEIVHSTGGHLEIRARNPGDDATMRFEVDSGEKMRIDSSGRLLVGTTTEGYSSADNFTVADSGNAGITIRSGTSQNGTIAFSDATSGDAEYDGLIQYSQNLRRFTFRTASTERALLMSDGGWATFSTAVNIDIANTQSAGINEAFIYARHSSTQLTGGTNSFRVYTNGNVQNTNNSYGSISDQNLKENIVDATSQWDDIKALQVRKYNFRENTGQQTHTQLGLIAQEAETVSPGLVQTTPVREDETVLDADGNELESIKSINYSVLYMKAVKALQEAQTRIETLETQNTAQQAQIDDLLTRVTALEAAE